MRRYRFIGILLVLALSSCDDKLERMDNYLVEFATVNLDGSKYCFRLDNDRLLIPIKTNHTGIEGQRVVLNYTPLQGDTVQVNRVSDVSYADIRVESLPNNVAKEPIKIQSIWVGGEYLNMIFETEYHSRQHKVALFRDTSSPSVDLHFAHSRDNDPPGYRQIIYCSFKLESLRTDTEDSIPFRLFINTYDGLRELHYILH